MADTESDVTEREEEGGSAQRAPGRRFARASADVLALASCAALAALYVVPRVNGLFPVELPPHPYWVVEHAWLLYFALPLVCGGLAVLFIAPGALIVLGRERRGPVAGILLKGFLVSIAVVAVLSLATTRLFEKPALPFVLSMILAAALAAAWSRRRGGTLFDAAIAGRRVAWLALLPAGAVAVLVPVVFWQDLNPDGLELLTMARSLDHHLIPRVPSGNLSGLGLGMVAAAYPVHAFYLIGGLSEASARLPVLIYLPMLFLGTLVCVEACGHRRLAFVDELLLASAVSGVFVAMIYNATYHAYSADAASPAAIDLLAAVCLLGMLWTFAERDWGWFLAFTAAGYFARPTPVLFCGLLIVAQVGVDRRGWRRTIPALVAAIVLCVLLAAVYERGGSWWLGAGLEEPSAGVAGRRLRYIVFADWWRLAYVAAPAGILPFFSLIAFTKQDRLTRVWAITALLFIAFFWFPAFSALHHYLPATLLSLLVFWRLAIARSRLAPWRVTALAAVVVAFALSLPASFAVDRSSRRIAREIDFRVGDYLGSPNGFQSAFNGKKLVEALFPSYEHAQPERQFMSSPLVFVHYATMTGFAGRDSNYLILPPGEHGEAPWARVAETDAGSAWVRDRDRWQQQLSHPPPTAFRSRLLAIPREALLPTWGVSTGWYDLDVYELLHRWIPIRVTSEW